MRPFLVSLVQPNRHYRARLRLFGVLVSVFICRCSNKEEAGRRWILTPVSRERSCIALIARLNPENEGTMDFFMVPNTKGQTRYMLSTDDLWLQRGLRLRSIEDFVPAGQTVNAQRRLANPTDRGIHQPGRFEASPERRKFQR